MKKHPNEFYIFKQYKTGKAYPIYLIKYDVSLENWVDFNIFEISSWDMETHGVYPEDTDLICKGHIKSVDGRLHLDFTDVPGLYLYDKNGLDDFKILLDYLYLIGYENTDDYVKDIIDSVNNKDKYYEYKNDTN